MILSYFHRSQCTFCCTIHSWTYISKTDIDWSLPGDCLNSWNTWMCADTVCLFLFQDVGRFVFSLALQHQSNWWWFSNLCRPLYLTYLEPWILQENVACLHFQQFLHCEMLGFILAPLIVAIYLPILKHLLIKLLALLLLWMSQISI